MDQDPSENQEIQSSKESHDARDEEFSITPYFRDFLTHLEELRIRLIRAVLILTGGTVICLIFSEQLINILTHHFVNGERPFLALLYPTEGFVVRLKISFVTGLFITSPFWFWQLWGFLVPAFTEENEKRIIRKVIIPAMLASSGMFIIGAGFGYWVLPYAAQYFKSLAPGDVAVYWSLGKYLDFALRMLVAFALVFELPFIIYIAALIGVVTPKQLRKYRRHAIIAILVAAAIITPPDLFTQIMLAIPLVILYEVGILMAGIAIRRKRSAVDNPDTNGALNEQH